MKIDLNIDDSEIGLPVAESDIIHPTQPAPERVHRSEGIHVSDRILYKRCRRKWHWQSPIRGGLEAIGETITPLWFGTGFHFALDDFHGLKRFGRLAEAFKGYCESFSLAERPDEYDELLELGMAMADYYEDHWLPRRSEFKTLVIDGVPQTEVDFRIQLPGRALPLQGTFDRVVVDGYNRIWIQEYKTAIRLDEGKLDTDPQITTYTLAATVIYGVLIEGVLYTQFMKIRPEGPKLLKDGTLSKNKSQHTTYALYRKALIETYGKKVPGHYVDFLNYLVSLETPDGDRYIRRHLVRRNLQQQRAELFKILAESKDMLDPNLPLYPNPTRDCKWDCPFRVPCIALDDGGDYQYLLKQGYTQREKVVETWRNRLQYPQRTLLLGQASKSLEATPSLDPLRSQHQLDLVE